MATTLDRQGSISRETSTGYVSHGARILDCTAADQGRYIVDGNALFMTATEAAWRRATGPHYSGGGIVVAIGYPLEGQVYDKRRRAFDMTPPCPGSTAEFGGGNAFLDFIRQDVRELVTSRFPQLNITREALFGHSYGGLFVLHALFASTSLFDCYMSSSPSLEWADYYILKEEKGYTEKSDLAIPSLMMFFGSYEQDPPQWHGETQEHYDVRKAVAAARGTGDNIKKMRKRLQDSEKLSAVTLNEYEGEDHGSVMACALSRALTTFFEEWPLDGN